VAGCAATRPVTIVVRRAGKLLSFSLRPRYNVADKRLLVGVDFSQARHAIGPVHAASLSITAMWSVTTQTVSKIATLFEPKSRSQIHGVVYSYTVTQRSFSHDTTFAIQVLGLISLSLAVVNLFPFLPLDGGHIFWALAEKVRGRRIPFEVMERAGVVGFVLIIMLFAIGLSNDISSLSGKGLPVP
jgi:regulator of sigma E protease